MQLITREEIREPKNVAEMAATMSEAGEYCFEPILAIKETGEIMDGHHRFAAAEAAGVEPSHITVEQSKWDALAAMLPIDMMSAAVVYGSEGLWDAAEGAWSGWTDEMQKACEVVFG